MDDKPLAISKDIKDVRNTAISRRGGVRTRGGRLPPVNLRELSQMTGNKKVMVPKIPQRRKNIKKEIDSPPVPLIKTESIDSSENLRERGRGRGRQQKVFLQTEGSFLAEGPAAKLKKDPVRCESYASSSYSRKTACNVSEAKVDSEVIKELLESYDADEVYEDDCDIKPPYRLPLPKEDIRRTKSEINEDEIKKEIKKEFIVDAESGIKREIKTEAEEDFKIAKDEADCKEQIPFNKNIAEEFQYVKGNGELILLVFPRLTVAVDEESTEKSSKNKQSQKESEKMSSVFTDNLEEGLIGKLRIMKSGKIKIVIGSMEFELIEGSPLESYLEVASLQVHEDEADLALLGKIRKKLLVCPMINTFIPEDDSADLTLRNS